MCAMLCPSAFSSMVTRRNLTGQDITELILESDTWDTRCTWTVFFLSPALFDDLHAKAIKCCGTVRPNRKGIPKNFGHKMKLKRGNLKIR